MLTAALALFTGLLAIPALAYDNSRSDNVVAYWGQNSYGVSVIELSSTDWRIQDDVGGSSE
jgi:hypothetical protein